MVADPVVKTLSGYKESPCSVTGTFPITTQVIKDSKTLVNSDTSTITIILNGEGNYTCLAKSEYGTDAKNFTVVLNGESFLTEKGIFSFSFKPQYCIIYSKGWFSLATES